MSMDGLQQAKLAICQAVNLEINRSVTYVSDQAQFGLSEYWQTSREVFRRLAGDCEDQAIVKAAVLWDQHGFSEYELTLAAGFVLADGPSGARFGHAVALWWSADDFLNPWVLDNGAVSLEVVRYSTIRERLDLWACCNRHEQWRLVRRP